MSDPTPYDVRRLQQSIVAGNVYTDANGKTWRSYGGRSGHGKGLVSNALMGWMRSGNAVEGAGGVWRMLSDEERQELDAAVERHPAGSNLSGGVNR